MAIFLTIAVIELLVAEYRVPTLDIMPLFLQQMCLGLVAGIGSGPRHSGEQDDLGRFAHSAPPGVIQPSRV